MPEDLPILYSFRRCPYAMRARLAVVTSGVAVELREVVLRDKPWEMIEASPKGTVPVLVKTDGGVLEESLDIIEWALAQNDPEGWLDYSQSALKEMKSLVIELDGSFKSALDRYKYDYRSDVEIAREHRELAVPFLQRLDGMLNDTPFLFGDKFSYADGVCLPFVRQFAHVDRDWFWAQDWVKLTSWLEGFLNSERFAAIMTKYPKWDSDHDGVRFGG